MISWLLVIIIAYLFFALSAFGDKVILSGPPKPKSYTFYAGILNIFVVLAIPFVGLQIPSINMFFWIVLDAIIFVLGLYFGFSAVEDFEISKVSATIGATQPIFIFFISYIFWRGQTLSTANFLAFILLFLGSVLISSEKGPELTKRYFKITMFASLLFSLDYVLLKFIFTELSFAQGFIWTRIFISVFALFLLFKKSNRKEIFKKGDMQNKKLQKTFLATQACGGAANILQSFAISLAPIAFLPIVNSLRGLQYAFLFAITLLASFFFPKILKEGISKKAIWQKVISIVIIGAGLAMLII